MEDDVIAAVPRHIARKYRVIPVYKHDNTLTVAIADPSDLATIDSLAHLLKSEINLQVASEQDIESALNKYYGGGKQTHVDKIIQDITSGEVDIGGGPGFDDAPVVAEEDAPLIRLVNQIIVDAFKMRASDIHLEPLAKNSGCGIASTA